MVLEITAGIQMTTLPQGAICRTFTDQAKIQISGRTLSSPRPGLTSELVHIREQHTTAGIPAEPDRHTVKCLYSLSIVLTNMC